MAGKRPIDPAPAGRREFFRHSIHGLLRPLADFLEERLPPPLPEHILRPPGALPETRFLETCYRCGNCAAACPVNAIKLLHVRDAKRTGTPYVEPNVAACVACQEVACTKACPSGALSLITDSRQIDMGLAVVDDNLCVRSRGQDCTLCVDKCPIGRDAIRLDEAGWVYVIKEGCVGCGVCQLYCPTTPKAVVVHPPSHKRIG